MKSYILFTGTDCHLCDVAKQMLRQHSQSALDISEINVKVERDFFHEYGARIPVLKNTDNNAELEWPFDEQSLKEFIK